MKIKDSVAPLSRAFAGRTINFSLNLDLSIKGRPVRITNALRAKGSMMAVVPSDAPVTVMLAQMAKHRVGAVVVVDAGTVVGMAWKRDVIRSCMNAELRLFRPELGDHEHRRDQLHACRRGGRRPTDYDRRIRHLPVMVGDKLSGIVSMGDLAKARIGELETNRAYLQSYIDAG